MFASSRLFDMAQTSLVNFLISSDTCCPSIIVTFEITQTILAELNGSYILTSNNSNIPANVLTLLDEGIVLPATLQDGTTGKLKSVSSSLSGFNLEKIKIGSFNPFIRTYTPNVTTGIPLDPETGTTSIPANPAPPLTKCAKSFSTALLNNGKYTYSKNDFAVSFLVQGFLDSQGIAILLFNSVIYQLTFDTTSYSLTPVYYTEPLKIALAATDFSCDIITLGLIATDITSDSGQFTIQPNGRYLFSNLNSQNFFYGNILLTYRQNEVLMTIPPVDSPYLISNITPIAGFYLVLPRTPGFQTFLENNQVGGYFKYKANSITLLKTFGDSLKQGAILPLLNPNNNSYSLKYIAVDNLYSLSGTTDTTLQPTNFSYDMPTGVTVNTVVPLATNGKEFILSNSFIDSKLTSDINVGKTIYAYDSDNNRYLLVLDNDTNIHLILHGFASSHPPSILPQGAVLKYLTTSQCFALTDNAIFQSLGVYLASISSVDMNTFLYLQITAALITTVQDSNSNVWSLSIDSTTLNVTFTAVTSSSQSAPPIGNYNCNLSPIITINTAINVSSYGLVILTYTLQSGILLDNYTYNTPYSINVNTGFHFLYKNSKLYAWKDNGNQNASLNHSFLLNPVAYPYPIIVGNHTFANGTKTLTAADIYNPFSGSKYLVLNQDFTNIVNIDNLNVTNSSLSSISVINGGTITYPVYPTDPVDAVLIVKVTAGENFSTPSYTFLSLTNPVFQVSNSIVLTNMQSPNSVAVQDVIGNKYSAQITNGILTLSFTSGSEVNNIYFNTKFSLV